MMNKICLSFSTSSMGLLQVTPKKYLSCYYHDLPRKLRSSWPTEQIFPMFLILEHKEQSILGSQAVPVWILFWKTSVWSLVLIFFRAKQKNLFSSLVFPSWICPALVIITTGEISSERFARSTKINSNVCACKMSLLWKNGGYTEILVKTSWCLCFKTVPMKIYFTIQYYYLLAIATNNVWFDLEDFVVFFLIDWYFIYCFNRNLCQPIYHKPIRKICTVYISNKLWLDPSVYIPSTKESRERVKTADLTVTFQHL